MSLPQRTRPWETSRSKCYASLTADELSSAFARQTVGYRDSFFRCGRAATWRVVLGTRIFSSIFRFRFSRGEGACLVLEVGVTLKLLSRPTTARPSDFSCGAPLMSAWPAPLAFAYAATAEKELLPSGRGFC